MFCTRFWRHIINKKFWSLRQLVNRSDLFIKPLGSSNLVVRCINFRDIKNRRKEWLFISLSVKRSMEYSYALTLLPEDSISPKSIGSFNLISLKMFKLMSIELEEQPDQNMRVKLWLLLLNTKLSSLKILNKRILKFIKLHKILKNISKSIHH